MVPIRAAGFKPELRAPADSIKCKAAHQWYAACIVWPFRWRQERDDPDQIGSDTDDPLLNGPTAVFGGAVPEQTGLPYLSRRAER